MQRNGQVEISVGSASFGNSTIAVLVKRSYRLIENGVAERLSEDAPFHRTDQYFDGAEPPTALVEYESELGPFKELADVVIVGHACAPNDEPRQQMTVEVKLGGKHKKLLLTGDRTAHFQFKKSPVFSEPQPFTTMPVRYDRAYGGRDLVSDPNLPLYYPRNDLGVGLALSNLKEVIDGLRLPNIEDPLDLLTPDRLVIGNPNRWHMQPVPQGLGWRHRSWFPRCCLIGAYPAFLDAGTVTVEEQLGLLPSNFVALAKQSRLAPNLPLFANGASLGLSFENLESAAAVELVGFSPSGKLAFQLPDDTPSVGIDVGQGMNSIKSKLFTVTIVPHEMRIEMIWAAHYEVGSYAQWSQISDLQTEVY